MRQILRQKGPYIAQIVLTVLALKSLKAERSTRFYDTNFPGFGVIVGKRRKTFFVLTGEPRAMTTLGHYPRQTLKDARKAALAVMEGKTAPQIRFAEAFERYIRGHLVPNTRPRTAYQVEVTLKAHFSHFLSTDLNEITRVAITDVVDSLRSQPYAAKQAASVINAFLNWCVFRGFLEQNPMLGYRANIKVKSRERLLADEEVSLVWRSLTTEPFSSVVRLLILTGQRLNQIQSLERTWVEKDRIVFPASIMKSGASHTIPLTTEVERTLDVQPAINRFFFVGISDTKSWTVNSKHMRALRPQLTIPHFTLHDLRRYFSSTMAKIGTPIDVTEAILDHKTGSRSAIQRVYDRHDRFPQMQTALHKYQAFLLDNVLPRS